jgi:hypothetical protein
LSQNVSDPPEKRAATVAKPGAAPVTRSHSHLSKMSLISLFALIGLSLLLFSGQIFQGLTQVNPAVSTPQAKSTQTIRATPSHTAAANPLFALSPTATVPVTTPFFAPDNSVITSSLPLPTGHYVLYQSMTHIYLVSTTDEAITPLYTPDYMYSQAVSPILTPQGQLLYSGENSLWLTDIFDQQPMQIVQLDQNTVITSLALSEDGTAVAWSTAPVSGNGEIDIYAGPLTGTQLVSQQSTQNCPCLAAFAFLNGSTKKADTTLLLTDNRNSGEALEYGLWSLNIADPSAVPHLIMGGNDSQQGPLIRAPYSNTLLYSSNEQAVPVPTDGSVPANIAALSYSNSLSITSLSGSPLTISASQAVLPGQQILGNTALYRWVTTPTFSPDGETLAYVEFSSDSQPPYDRHSALYTVSVHGSGSHLKVGQAKLVVTSTARLLELGPWLNSHVVMMYGDGSLYALDVLSGSITLLTRSRGYLRILAVVGIGQT